MKKSQYENRRRQAMLRSEIFDGTEMLALRNDLDNKAVQRNGNTMERRNVGAENPDGAGPSPNKRAHLSNSNSITGAVATPSNNQSSCNRGKRTARKSTGGYPVDRNANYMKLKLSNVGGNAGIIGNVGGNQRVNNTGGIQQAPEVGGNQRDGSLGGRNDAAGSPEVAGPSPKKRLRFFNSDSTIGAVPDPNASQPSRDRGQRTIARKSTGGYYKSLIWSHISENISVAKITSFICPLCSKQFKDGKKCVDHMDNIHCCNLTRYYEEEVDGYACPVCPEPKPWFRTPWHFILHCAQNHMARTD